MGKIRVSDQVVSLTVGNDSFIIWNRFSPSLLRLNKAGMEFIEKMKKLENIEITRENKNVIESLIKYKILYKGNHDPFKEDFVTSIADLFEAVKKNASNFYKNHHHFFKLTITNDACNLKCSYCVNEHKKPGIRKPSGYAEKKKNVNDVIDQFFSSIIERGEKKTRISFNGGEILLEWPLLKSILERINEKYRDLQIEFTINTNMTLMTEEIARFFNKYNFKVFISIDGYKKAHDKTRKYHDGRGSFEDIIKGIEIYREFNENYFIKGFQGTIENIDEFDLREVYKMSKYGFIEARLAPNLLGVSREDAVKKARLVGRFLDLNPDNQLTATEVYFKNMTKVINKDDYSFFFNCKGLSSFPEISLCLNITNQRVSQLCSFIPAASLPLDELQHDIYNPILWKQTETFIKDRIDSLFKNCLGCDLVAVCRGGCIYTGLDKENTFNESACAYQRELWNIYIKKVYQVNDDE